MRDIPANRQGQKRLRRLLRTKGFEAELGGRVGEGEEEVALKTCPWCGNPNNNCRINVYKRAVRCWACSESDRLERFLKNLLNEDIRSVSPDVDDSPQMRRVSSGGPETVPLKERPAAFRYWSNRGLTEAQAHRYSVGVCVEEGHPLEGRIVFPVREYWTGDPFGWIGRAYTSKGRRYLNETDGMRVAGFREGGRPGTHVLVEGPFDAFRMDQAGWQAGALLGSDMETARSWIAETVRRAPEDDIVIVLDGDARDRARSLVEAGRRARGRGERGTTVAQTLPEGKDPADYTPRSARKMVASALESRAGA